MSSDTQPLPLPSIDHADGLEAITKDLLPSASQYTSFALRNPSKDIIPLRANGDRSVARTADDVALRREAKQSSNGKLEAAIETHLEQRKGAMETLAREHNVPLAVIEQRCNSLTVYKKPRKVNLANAITHAKSKEYNKDLPMGERLRLDEIIKKIQGESDKDLSKEEKATLLENLEKHRRNKKTGARANNKAAGKDAAATIAKFQRELLNLHERTGIHGFALFARGHVDDANCLEVCETPGALDFSPTVLGHSVHDLVRLFDAHTSTKGVMEAVTGDKRPSLRAALSEAIKLGLEIAVNNKKAKMNYASYETAIVAKHHVEIVGWPEELLPISSPSEMSNALDLRTLVGLWRTGACRWRTLSTQERLSHAEEVAAKTQTGAVRTRKERSDKGTTKKRKADDIENDGAPVTGLAKRAKRTAKETASGPSKVKNRPAKRPTKAAAAAALRKTLPPKSREIIDTEEEDSEGGDDDYERRDTSPPGNAAAAGQRKDMRARTNNESDEEEVDELDDY